MKYRLLFFTLFIVGGISIGTSYALTTLSVGDDATMDPTKKLYLDGGANSYIYSPQPFVIDFVTGDSIAMRSEKNAGVVKTIIPSTQRLYLDGGANSYIYSPSASIIDFVVGDSLLLRNEKSGGFVNLILPQTNKLWFDGGANTYLSSSSFATLDIYTGSIQTITANNGKVGIGTGTPLEKLDVAGNIRLTGNIVSPNDICIGTCS